MADDLAEDEVKLSPHLQEWIGGWVDSKSKGNDWTLPSVNLKTGKLSKPLDTRFWPSCFKDCPDPVIASRGQTREKVLQIFQSAGKRVFFCHWQVLYNDLVPIIYCPKCEQIKNLEGDGWTLAKVRRVCMLIGPAFLVSKCYRCKKCPGNEGKDYQFRAHDEGVIKQLSAALEASLNIRFTQHGAVDVSLMDFLLRNVSSGVAFADSADAVQELHYITYNRSKLGHMQYTAERGKLALKRASYFNSATVASGQVPPPADFGAYEDKQGYRGWIPSRSYLTRTLLAYLTERLAWPKERLAMVDGLYLRGDHTFRSASKVKVQEGGKAYEAMYTVMNGFSKVAAQWMVGDTSFREIEGGLRDLMKRYEENFQDRWANLGTIRNSYTLCHGTGDFMRDLSRAMFVIKAGDKESLRNHLLQRARKKLTAKEIAAKPDRYWNTHCRRTIPKKELLAARLDAVLKKYEIGGNACDGDPLVTRELNEVHERQMKLVWAGALSDPLGVEEMYYDVSKPGCMPQFKSVRGTSKLEGYHKHLNSLFAGGNCSPELADALLTIFNYRWNITCGVANRGDQDYSMHDHFLLEEMQKVCRDMGWPDPFPEWKKAPPTAERFGADNLPPEVREALEAAAAIGEPAPTEDDLEAVAVEELLEQQALAKQGRDAGGRVAPPPPRAVALATCPPLRPVAGAAAPPLQAGERAAGPPLQPNVHVPPPPPNQLRAQLPTPSDQPQPFLAPRPEQSPEILPPPIDQCHPQLAPPSAQTRVLLPPPSDQLHAPLAPPSDQWRASLTPPSGQSSAQPRPLLGQSGASLSPPSEQLRTQLPPCSKHSSAQPAPHSQPSRAPLAPPSDQPRVALPPRSANQPRTPLAPRSDQLRAHLAPALNQWRAPLPPFHQRDAQPVPPSNQQQVPQGTLSSPNPMMHPRAPFDHQQARFPNVSVASRSRVPMPCEPLRTLAPVLAPASMGQNVQLRAIPARVVQPQGPQVVGPSKRKDSVGGAGVAVEGAAHATPAKRQKPKPQGAPVPIDPDPSLHTLPKQRATTVNRSGRLSYQRKTSPLPSIPSAATPHFPDPFTPFAGLRPPRQGGLRPPRPPLFAFFCAPTY
ncbi:hypothetical protein KFL_006900010 [Klebsormidium nitens]|uniref:Uncharacterized protein n=1 Tax=Klebsormidium nitens TaxID=105231 RepID=A0A1Y1IPZ6_KLENI|nr:hypothetical protein KFL_006900010 [Klebsormidium nitens]|eukprot:GAQ90826.1 hypothetical protein KFL_006900010 [Klebsormidium nitens]